MSEPRTRVVPMCARHRLLFWGGALVDAALGGSGHGQVYDECSRCADRRARAGHAD